MKKILSALALSSLLIAGCSGNFPEIYKPDLKQGIILNDQQINQLRPGLTRIQVLQLLGTPPIADPLHTNRWDYVYLYFPRQNRSKGEEKYMTLYFDSAGILQRIDKEKWK